MLMSNTLSMSLRIKTLKNTDTRLNLTNEVISGIKVIKMNSWEKAFEKIIKQIRRYNFSLFSNSVHLIGPVNFYFFKKNFL
jgi:ATP-binding cassette subfamily C (CFTR/MRP) protein 4